MEIVHQLPGRVRIRNPEIESEGYCSKIVEELANDDRITDMRISSACNSMVVCYDPVRIQIKELLNLLRKEAPVEPSGKSASKSVSMKEKGAEPSYFKPAVSSDVQERIRQLISEEDPHRPLSDGSISRLLKKEKAGIAAEPWPNTVK